MENQTASKGNKYIDYACDGRTRSDEKERKL